MSKAYVLMTAMPPTKGHLQLIQFANLVSDSGTVVIVSTQPHEPMANQRVAAIRKAVASNGLKNVRIIHHHDTIEQDPKAPGFWDTWRELMISFGVTPDDYIVASETYGQKLAELTGSKFYPYDIGRDINPIKATPIREDTLGHFKDIIPEFQKYLTTKVTIFGAESTGKTTLSHELASKLDAYWLFEYARPYLETTVNEITTSSMTAIWRGQSALQRQADNLFDKPVVIQDTDLFSTVGYWQFPHWKKTLGNCPEDLVKEAIELKSDLYIVTKSNIPFEKDPLRYGGDKREGSDQYWLNVCRQYKLPYIELGTNNKDERLVIAESAVLNVANKKVSTISFNRKGL